MEVTTLIKHITVNDVTFTIVCVTKEG